MSARVSGRVQRTKANRWLTLKCNLVALFNKSIDLNVRRHFLSGKAMRGHANVAAQMRPQGIDATNVIGMQMR